ncbi:hypothetical protein H4582DRAFT_2100960, partial [Lactarius indigo]
MYIFSTHAQLALGLSAHLYIVHVMSVILRTFSLRTLEQQALATRERKGALGARNLTRTSNEPLVLQVFRTDVEITPPEKGVLGVSQSWATRSRMQLVHIRQHSPVSQATETRSSSTLTFSSSLIQLSLFTIPRIFLSYMLDDLRTLRHAHADA